MNKEIQKKQLEEMMKKLQKDSQDLRGLVDNVKDNVKKAEVKKEEVKQVFYNSFGFGCLIGSIITNIFWAVMV